MWWPLGDMRAPSCHWAIPSSSAVLLEGGLFGATPQAHVGCSLSCARATVWWGTPQDVPREGDALCGNWVAAARAALPLPLQARVLPVPPVWARGRGQHSVAAQGVWLRVRPCVAAAPLCTLASCATAGPAAATTTCGRSGGEHICACISVPAYLRLHICACILHLHVRVKYCSCTAWRHGTDEGLGPGPVWW